MKNYVFLFIIFISFSCYSQEIKNANLQMEKSEISTNKQVVAVKAETHSQTEKNKLLQEKYIVSEPYISVKLDTQVEAVRDNNVIIDDKELEKVELFFDKQAEKQNVEIKATIVSEE